MSRRDRRDEDDGGGEGGSARRRSSLIACDRLREEVRPLQVRCGSTSSKLSSVASRRSMRARGARPALFTSALGTPIAARTSASMRPRSSALRQIAAEVVDLRRPARAVRRARTPPSGSGRRPPSASVHSVTRERARDAEADAAGAAGDECAFHGSCRRSTTRPNLSK